MARLVVLGTAGAVATVEHGHTYLGIECAAGVLLVDSGDAPVARLRRAELPIDRLQACVLTHFHPDHIGTFPGLLISAWLLGRSLPLPVYGLQDTLGRLATMMDLYRSGSWPAFFGLQYHPVPAVVGASVIEIGDLRITAAPTEHSVPSIALRIESLSSGAVVVYSSDTEPCDDIVALAKGADVLFHEAMGAGVGHSSPAQAGEVAHRANVSRLVLVHYPPDPEIHAGWASLAARTFGGPVELAQDFDAYAF